MGIVGTNFLESYLEEYFVGTYFYEFKQKCRNCEKSGTLVPFN